MNNLLKTAQNWANQDPDQETRDELQALIDAGKYYCGSCNLG